MHDMHQIHSSLFDSTLRLFCSPDGITSAKPGFNELVTPPSRMSWVISNNTDICKSYLFEFEFERLQANARFPGVNNDEINGTREKEINSGVDIWTRIY